MDIGWERYPIHEIRTEGVKMNEEVTMKYTLKKGQRVIHSRRPLLEGEILDFRHEGVLIRWQDGGEDEYGFVVPLPRDITEIETVRGKLLELDKDEVEDVISGVTLYRYRELIGSKELPAEVSERLDRILKKLHDIRGF